MRQLVTFSLAERLMPDRDWILYGATGYTGRLIAEEAAKRESGARPILAGRNAAAVESLARTLELHFRTFDLTDPARLRESIRGVRLVLNCAGPFSATSQPLFQACLAERVHYLDITGEIDVIEAAAALDQKAKQAGVTLLPAVGFDVVPSDCLAASLGQKLPDACRLQLAICGLNAISPGTAKTMLEGMPQGGRARIAGRIERVPTAWKTREIPFREGPRTAMTIPWGDVASAHYSTGIGEIEVYAAAPPQQITLLRRWRWLLPCLRLPVVQGLARWLINSKVVGPSATQREHETASLWGCVENANGRRVEGTLTTPNGYTLTVLTALASVERIFTAPPSTGFQTPSRAFGADFITTIPGCDLQISPATG
jgi:short subunit dehydrogenase-like uncharacterized protein